MMSSQRSPSILVSILWVSGSPKRTLYSRTLKSVSSSFTISHAKRGQVYFNPLFLSQASTFSNISSILPSRRGLEIAGENVPIPQVLSQSPPSNSALWSVAVLKILTVSLSVSINANAEISLPGINASITTFVQSSYFLLKQSLICWIASPWVLHTFTHFHAARPFAFTTVGYLSCSRYRPMSSLYSVIVFEVAVGILFSLINIFAPSLSPSRSIAVSWVGHSTNIHFFSNASTMPSHRGASGQTISTSMAFICISFARSSKLSGSFRHSTPSSFIPGFHQKATTWCQSFKSFTPIACSRPPWP